MFLFCKLCLKKKGTGKWQGRDLSSRVQEILVSEIATKVSKTPHYQAEMLQVCLFKNMKTRKPKYALLINLAVSTTKTTISDNNIGQWLPFPPYPLPNVVLLVQKIIERKVDIIVATLKEGKRGRAFF